MSLPDTQVSTAASSPSKSVHATYSALVRDGDDLVGLIAYALYKSEKIGFVEQHKKRHGSAPSEHDLMTFICVFNMPAQISAYRDRATQLLEAMNEELLDQVLTELQGEHDSEKKQLERNYEIRLVEDLKKAAGFWKGVGQNIVANLGAAAITIFVVILVYGSRISFLPVLGEMFNYEVKEKASGK